MKRFLIVLGLVLSCASLAFAQGVNRGGGGGPIPQTLLSAATTGAQSIDLVGRPSTRCTIYVEFSTGTTVGTVVIEEASSASWGGTWSAIGDPIVWGAANTSIAIHLNGPFGALRTNISVTVSGGTVTTKVQCI